MAWIILIVAGLFETVWAVSMKYSEGFTRLWPSVITAVAMVISLYLLAVALRTLPLGTAYTVWTGIGALGTVIYGIAVFGESKDLLKMVFVMMILGGIVGLKIVSDKESARSKTEQGKTVRTESETGNNTPRRP
ncbi:MAG: quaternary ammonium compound-resistance protein SugE [Bacteroidetes bacterium]|nr:MAG: quaternary ammonium compound-resistance protein SugE [Bacteroidota bacterium]